MRKLSAITRIAISLVCLSISLLLVAGTLGFFPDRRSDVMAGRMKLAESLALSFSSMATHTDTQTMASFFESVVERNPDMVSLGLRKAEGILLLDVGEHEKRWKPLGGDRSSEAQLVVPVETANRRWGTVEVNFQPLTKSGLAGFITRKEVSLTAFMAVSLFISYYFYLGRVLTQLNPSKVIPSRVREALDSLAEGILVMDSQQKVILANRAFEQATGQATPHLMGKPVTDLSFVCRDDDEGAGLPWQETISKNAIVTGRLLGIENGKKTFSVSSAPIVDERGASRGVLASFEDVTQLRDKKEELRLIVGHLHKSSAEIRRQNLELEQLANYDPLTGCHNRRSFFERFDALWKAALRYHAPISAIMVDIDHFKSINDNHGHSAGDDVLRRVAGALQSKMRETDILCRYGGEEFAALLPHTDIGQAEIAAERYREAIAELRISQISVTASLGVSALSEGPADPQELLDQADKCLYVAKRSGRNRVVRWDRVDHDDLEEGGSVGESKEVEPVQEQNSIPFHAVTALVSALAFRDQDTATHSRRVADLCVAMAEGLLSHKDCYTLEMAALLHDIGKIGVPDAILLKPDRLTPSEWDVMKSYASIGVEIVHASFASTALTDLVRTYRYRAGDPQAERMTVGARILAVADAYDSMTSHRTYRTGCSHEEAMTELRANAGEQFDAELVERLDRVIACRSKEEMGCRVSQSAEIALNIGAQIERLVAALDAQDLDCMAVLAERLEVTATRYGANEIARKATDLQHAFNSDDCDLFGVMQSATELLDLCRSTQGALLDRPRTLLQRT